MRIGNPFLRILCLSFPSPGQRVHLQNSVSCQSSGLTKKVPPDLSRLCSWCDSTRALGHSLFHRGPSFGPFLQLASKPAHVYQPMPCCHKSKYSQRTSSDYSVCLREDWSPTAKVIVKNSWEKDLVSSETNVQFPFQNFWNAAVADPSRNMQSGQKQEKPLKTEGDEEECVGSLWRPVQELIIAGHQSLL